MELGEEKAKEILDFLVKKAGYCELSIRSRYGHYKSSQFVITCKPKLDLDNTLYDIDYQLWYAANHSFPNFSIISLRSMSYTNALKTVLKLSRSGKDIFCRNNLILPVHTSLEEIIIKMDLEKWI